MPEMPAPTISTSKSVVSCETRLVLLVVTMLVPHVSERQAPQSRPRYDLERIPA